MKKLNLLFLFFVICAVSYAQTPQSICAGSTEDYNVKNPTAGSTYEWGVYLGSGTLNNGISSDKISITWNNTVGKDSIWVQETNVDGCVGDKTILIIERKPAPNAYFDNELLCAGETLNIKLTGTPPFSVEYTFNGTTVTKTGINTTTYLVGNTSGDYKLLKVSSLGCKNSSLSGTVNSKISSPLPQLQILHN